MTKKERKKEQGVGTEAEWPEDRNSTQQKKANGKLSVQKGVRQSVDKQNPSNLKELEKL